MKLSDYIAQNGDREIDSEKLDELLQIKKNKVWKPEEGELCWFLNSCGNIIQMYWEDNELNISRYDRGYIKKTREECEELDKYRTTRTALKRYAEEHNDREIDYNIPTCRWVINWHCKDERLHLYLKSIVKGRDICFASEEIAAAAFKEIGEERIKQYLLYEG